MKISALTEQDLPEAAKTLLSSFRDYEVMRYFFQDSGADYDKHVAEFLIIFCRMGLKLGWPCLVAREGSSIVAVIAGRNAGSGDNIPELEEMETFYKSMTAATNQRMHCYEEGSAAMHSKRPHYFIEVIAVDPTQQGKGYAKLLLKAFEKLSNSDPLSEGVCLNTESASNVPFYQHNGYQLINDTVIDSLHSWCFFKSKN